MDLHIPVNSVIRNERRRQRNNWLDIWAQYNPQINNKFDLDSLRNSYNYTEQLKDDKNVHVAIVLRSNNAKDS